MLRRTLALATFLTLAGSLHAQEAPSESGPWVRYGTVSPEVQALDLGGDDWAVGYRTASGFSLGLTGTANEADEIFPTFNDDGLGGVFAERHEGTFRRAGLLGSLERDTRLGIVRVGLTAMYSYDRDTFTGLTLQDDVYYPDGTDGDPVGYTVLREDGNLRTERLQTQLSAGLWRVPGSRGGTHVEGSLRTVRGRCTRRP